MIIWCKYFVYIYKLLFQQIAAHSMEINSPMGITSDWQMIFVCGEKCYIKCGNLKCSGTCRLRRNVIYLIKLARGVLANKQTDYMEQSPFPRI